MGRVNSVLPAASRRAKEVQYPSPPLGWGAGGQRDPARTQHVPEPPAPRQARGPAEGTDGPFYYSELGDQAAGRKADKCVHGIRLSPELIQSPGQK